MLPSVPKQYVLMLKPCFKNNCLHPLCQAEANTLPEPTWFPSGPPLTYFPLPIPDTTRPWGADCNVCTGFCAGHYLKPEDAWKSYQEKGESICQIDPPSLTLQKLFTANVKKNLDLLKDENALRDIAKQVLLTPSEVTMWIEYLKAIKPRRKNG